MFAPNVAAATDTGCPMGDISVPNIKQASVKKFAHAIAADGSEIHSDGYTHEHKPYDSDSGLLHWLHIVISNAKTFILATCYGLSKKYLQSYLDEYSFRFCRRDFALPCWSV